MKLLMSSRKTITGCLIHLVHRVNFYNGTRCGAEISKPVYFDGDESLITCSRCGNPDIEKKPTKPRIRRRKEACQKARLYLKTQGFSF